MKLASIQVGLPKDVDYRGRLIRTAIFKTPVEGPVNVLFHHLEGDGQADLKVHGGADKAVYAYPMSAYRWWQKQRPKDTFTPGAFGENLTFEDLDETDICVGDTFALGSTILQAAEPRFPCFKLGIMYNDPKIIRTFSESDRPGVYFRVLREGVIEAGQTLTVLEREPVRVSILDLVYLLEGDEVDPRGIEKALSVKALPSKAREKLKRRLAREYE